MKKGNFDFGGYATKNGLKCTDGRTILKDAFKDNDGIAVPLVWQHQHANPDNVLGHAILENREDGVYAYCNFNDTPSGKNAKLLVEHKDIQYLSIYANGLIEKAKNVIHGVIREVSLVLAGANPGALIDFLAFEHGDGQIVTSEDEAIIYTGLNIDLKENEVKEEVKHEDANGVEDKTVGDVFNSLNEDQKTAVYAIIGALVGGDGESVAQSAINETNDEGDNKVMKKNVFDGSATEQELPHLTHDQFAEIVATAQKTGSFKQAFLQHVVTYGIENIDYLFPDARTLTPEPEMYGRDMTWVPVVFNGTRHTPFSRIKTVHADITADDARAKGYIKGSLKKEEFFGLAKRTTGPTTVYKKQKLDRDDIIDITDLDVVAWLKREMRFMLDEELARAVLIGDGREPEDEDKIDETCIRPIWTDADLYSHKVQLLSTVVEPIDLVDGIIGARVNYKGSGTPDLFMPSSILTTILLARDEFGHKLWRNKAELASELNVASIVEVEVMENQTRTVDETTYDLLGIMVNLRDYSMGADKGGAVSMFDDFDIDYNQYKYLIETRCSGALTKYKSALVIEREQGD
jgi:hypothetical protein